jgi:cytochrome P450
MGDPPEVVTASANRSPDSSVPQGSALPPEAGVFDLARLAVRFLGSAVRHPFRWSAGEIFAAWLHGLMESHGSQAVLLKLGPKRLLIVGGTKLSRSILDPPPSPSGFAAGGLKVGAVSFLADRALTVADGEPWKRLRSLNEGVLGTGREHPSAEFQLDAIRHAFGGTVGSVDELRRGMGEVMLQVVLGAKAPPRMVADIQTLFSLVQSPLKRRLFRRRGERIRKRFFTDLRGLWRNQNGARPSTLLGFARELGGTLEEEEVLHQVPHWMFTFTGSGTDLLLRGLALVGSRPACRERALLEIASAGFPDGSGSLSKLPYLESCLLEAGRLFPPVTRTFHTAPRGGEGAGYRIPPGVEILHYLPLLHRYDPRLTDIHDFRPERWLSEEGDRPYPGIFLSGSRACPGRDLILFVCKGAAATLLDLGLRLRAPGLDRDPLPLTFPDRRLVFS